MIPRSHDIVNALLLNVGLLPVEPDLPAPLKDLPAALEHGVMHIGRLVIEGDGARLVVRPHPRERLPHSGFSETGRKRRVAAHTLSRIRITVIGARDPRPSRRVCPHRECDRPRNHRRDRPPHR